VRFFGYGNAAVNNLGRNLALWAIIALLIVALFQLINAGNNASDGASRDIAFSGFIAEVEAGDVRDVTIKGNAIEGTRHDGTKFTTFAPDDPGLVARLSERGVGIRAEPATKETSLLQQLLISWVPFILLIGVWIFFMRQMQGGGGKAMGFGKSRARHLRF
jgi:cell division protease FtsH